jgi:hypothetical protein
MIREAYFLEHYSTNLELTLMDFSSFRPAIIIFTSSIILFLSIIEGDNPSFLWSLLKSCPLAEFPTAGPAE